MHSRDLGCENHPEKHPYPPIRGKFIFQETGPWCQEGWGPLLYRVCSVWQGAGSGWGGALDLSSFHLSDFKVCCPYSFRSILSFFADQSFIKTKDFYVIFSLEYVFYFSSADTVVLFMSVLRTRPVYLF